MKSIIHVITTIERGGAENQLLVVARAQLESGKNVKIFPLKGKLDLYQNFTDLGAQVNLRLLNKNPLKQIVLLKKFISTEECYVHAHLPRAELIVSLIFKKIDFVVSRHNTERFFPGNPAIFSIILSRYVTMRAKAVIAISMAVAKFLVDSREVSKKCTVDIVYYGYDEKFLMSKDSRTLIPRTNNQQSIIGSIGRLVPQKDYVTLLTSFSNYSKFKNDVILVILGDGYLEEKLKILAVKLGISEKIIWVGKTSNVLGYLNEFDVLVLTSRYEGFGLVLLEAMIAKVPVIASNNSAIPEVLGVNHPGLCETGNSEEFTRKMIEFTTTKNRLNVITSQNKRLEIFNPQLMASKLNSIYLRN